MPGPTDHRADGDQASERSVRLGTAERSDFEHVRRGSMRHAVRKIFNRSPKPTVVHAINYEASPKAVTPPLVAFTPSGTQPGASLLTKTTTTDRQPELTSYRTLSATMHVSSNNPTSNKIRTPNAVEFPHSAKLKPLNLGNPFANTSEQQLRRRKTSPSALKYTHLQTQSSRKASTDLPPLSDAKSSPKSDISQRGPDIDTSMQSQRRSRSAQDLDLKAQKEYTDSEKKAGSHQWQQNYPNSILRSSGFTTKSSVSEKLDEPVQATHAEDAHKKTSQITQPTTHRATDDGWASSRKPTKIRTIEETKIDNLQPITPDILAGRVSQLESIVLNFQKTFDGLAAEQEKKAITAQNLEQSLYDHFATNTRSSIKMTNPLSVSVDPPSAYQNVHIVNRMLAAGQMTPRDSAYSRETVGTGTPSPSPARHHHKSSISSGKTSPAGDHTFKSLYEMLIDERSARRKLEQQVKVLSRELADLRQEIVAQHNYSYTYTMDQLAQRAIVAASSPAHESLTDSKSEHIRTSHELYAKRTSAFHPPITNKTYEGQVPRDANKFQFDLAPTRVSASQSLDTDEDMF